MYILANKPLGMTYVGITNDIARRTYEHREGFGSKFCQKFNIKHLVYIEFFEDPTEAIACEKRLKKWHKEWKFKLIESRNPHWEDLYEKILW